MAALFMLPLLLMKELSSRAVRPVTCRVRYWMVVLPGEWTHNTAQPPVKYPPLLKPPPPSYCPVEGIFFSGLTHRHGYWVGVGEYGSKYRYLKNKKI